MPKTKLCAAIAAAAVMVVGIAGWVNSNDHAFEAKASTPLEASSLDAFEMMRTAKNLPNQEFEDLSLVFSSQWRRIEPLLPREGMKQT
jgi:hypothetical protein